MPSAEQEDLEVEWRPPSGLIPVPPRAEAPLVAPLQLDVAEVFPFSRTEMGYPSNEVYRSAEQQAAPPMAPRMQPLELDVSEVFPFGETARGFPPQASAPLPEQDQVQPYWRPPGTIGEKPTVSPLEEKGAPVPRLPERTAMSREPGSLPVQPPIPDYEQVTRPMQVPAGLESRSPTAGKPPAPASTQPARDAEARIGEAKPPTLRPPEAAAQKPVSALLDDLSPLPDIAIERTPLPAKPPELEPLGAEPMARRSRTQTALLLLAGICLLLSLFVPFDSSAWMRLTGGYYRWYDISPAVLGALALILALPRRVPLPTTPLVGFAAIGVLALVAVRFGPRLLELRGEAALQYLLLVPGCILLFFAGLVSLFRPPPHRHRDGR